MNAIKVGRLFHKPRDIETTVARSCRMQLFESDNRSHPLGRGGSATLIRHLGTDYVATTRHQLDISAGEPLRKDILEAIRIASSRDDMLSNVPLKSVRFETSNPDEEFHDLLFFEAADEWRNRNIDSPHFFELASFTNRPRQKSFVLGYPHLDVVMSEYLSDFDPERPGTIHMKQVLCDCTLDVDYKSSARHYRSYKLSQEQDVVDGLSGGVVFSLVGDLGNLEIVLDGIVVRAGRDRLQVVDSDYIITALNHTLEAS
jgi:hypothetical protein